MYRWFVAEAQRVIIATKTKTYQLGYKLQEGGGTVPDGSTPIDLASPPRLISLTPIKHGLDLGTPDVLKRRFTAAPRFATGLGDDMHSHDQKEEDGEADDSLQPIGGAWLDKNLVEPLLAGWTGDSVSAIISGLIRGGSTVGTSNSGPACATLLLVLTLSNNSRS
ncbi:hypothetical protein PSTG_18385 [Puccinia striiformis f. sp. tritici PST-78]|uniref:Uncharacterized protein n=1 Tax=Puccinia striiformis f. sp. tritici PST-78 TaxID=1165861 RepID=A0A0L0UMM5_9BASI|nr:hypothetical protein PSTG_18385 [Puccinia striiformis f. sp. tritici PST-78]